MFILFSFFFPERYYATPPCEVSIWSWLGWVPQKHINKEGILAKTSAEGKCGDNRETCGRNHTGVHEGGDRWVIFKINKYIKLEVRSWYKITFSICRICSFDLWGIHLQFDYTFDSSLEHWIGILESVIVTCSFLVGWGVRSNKWLLVTQQVITRCKSSHVRWQTSVSNWIQWVCTVAKKPFYVLVSPGCWEKKHNKINVLPLHVESALLKNAK